MKNFIQSSFNPLTEELETAIMKAKPISCKRFARQCSLLPIIALDILRYPDDYDFFQYKDILFYVRSSLEYFYR